MLVLSASIRFALRRKRAAAPAQLFAIVDRYRAEFLRVTILGRDERDEITFARWDEPTKTYRTVSGLRVTIAGEERAVAASIPIVHGPGMLGPADESGVTLSVPVHATMWILARVVEGEGTAGLRSGELAEPTLEPILDRFVVVRDANGPDAPHVYCPGYFEVLLYPGVIAAALVILTLRSEDPLSAQAWLFAALMILGLIELFFWSFFVVDRRGR
jgi:hypothetical protein